MAAATASERFSELDKSRQSVLDRAVTCSELTIPYIFRDVGTSDQDDLVRKFVQGFMTSLVNHLVGKFALSILPPSQPFYRLSATNEAMSAIAKDDQAKREEIEKILAEKEDGILRYINKSRFRTVLYPALRISIITGDSLIERIGDNEFRLFNMRRYVVKRDASGKILDIVIKENIDYDAVPDDIRSKITEENKDQPVELYTRAELVEGIYKVSQEINDEIVAGSEKDLKVLSDRFISLRWNRVDGEDYGRSYAEEFLGTIIALEKQLKVLNESAVIASKTVFTVNPNGMTKYSDFLDAANGDVIIGSETDIGTIKSNKHVDLQITHALVNEYKQELAQAFLMGSSAIRDAERVTAREVQMVATELESSFGGIYTAIAEDIQIPLVESAMKSLKIEAGKDIDIIITAGVEALGRNIEMSKINNLLNELGMLAQLVGPDEIKKVINVSSVTSSMVANSGVAGKNFLYTSSELAANDKAAKQEAMTQQMLQGGLPTAGQAMAGSAVQQMNQGA